MMRVPACSLTAAALVAPWLLLLGSCTARVSQSTARAPLPAVASSTSDEGSTGSADDGKTTDEGGDSEEPSIVDDEPEDEEPTALEAGETRPHPLDGWSDAELDRALEHEPERLGPMSIGQPSAGRLWNGARAEACDLFKPVSPGTAWGTRETLEFLDAALHKVHAEFPDAPALALGDISAEHGGHLSPHVSHQAGRDVDIGFFYTGEARWYRRGTSANFDRPRNWAFVRALISETDVEMILLDHSLQTLLFDYARSIGEDKDWLDGIFRGSAKLRPILRHAPGHATHFHVRFFNPIAQETARRLYPMLVRHHLIPPVQEYTHYRAKRGDTLGKLAKRFGTSVEAIKHANQLKKNLIREKELYVIPVKVSHPPAPPARLTFPARRVPPERASTADLPQSSKSP